MPVVGGLGTDNQGDDRESLLSILRDASPNTDNYLTSNLGSAPNATNVVHSWPVYNTARPTSVTFTVEGADASYSALDTPTLSTNYTAVITEPVLVTSSAAAVKIATGEDVTQFQKVNALKRLKAKMEWATINGTAAAGSCGVARGFAGIQAMISTNVTVLNTNTSFTEVELNNIVQDSWDQVGSEYVATTLLCPMVIGRRVSGFSANLTRMIDAKDKRLDSQVRVYGAQVGKDIMIVPHKDVRHASTSGHVFLINEDLFKYSFLVGQEPQYKSLAATGLAEKGEYYTELTLCSFAQRASCHRSGYFDTL